MRASLLIFLLPLLLAGCVSVPDDEAEKQAAAKLVWPPAPERARIGFVQIISQPEDLAISKGFFQRLADFIFGESQDRMVRPMAIVESGNYLYVADPGIKGVHRYDRGAGHYTLIQGEARQPILSPVGLAADADGNVYVSDSAQGAVFLIKPGAEFAVRLALSEAPRQPTGIAVDNAAKRLLVVDTGQHHIKVYDLNGQFLKQIGKRGREPLEFNFPTMLWHDRTGKLLLTDSLNFRTQLLTTEGAHLRDFGRAGDAAGDAPRQKGIATDRHGHIYTVDSLLHAVQIFDQSGQFLLSFGMRGQAAGEFWLPTGIFVGEDDLIYVADSYNKRVQVFRYIGGAS
jgi:DNA-binding beta-propeller fold protein YncE